MHRNSTSDCFLWRAIGYNFDIIVAARLEISLESPRDILHARTGVRTLQQIDELWAKRLRTVNSLAGKCDVTERILSPLVNWNDDIDVVTLRLKLIARRIDYS